MKDWSPEEIKNLRCTYKLTQAKFASLLGVVRNYIYQLEKGVKQPSKTLNILLSYVAKDLEETGQERKKKGGISHGKRAL